MIISIEKIQPVMIAVDNILNKLTMYRLVLYVLTFLIAISFLFSFFNLLPFRFFDFFISTIILTFCCWSINTLISRILNIASNFESSFISAFILVLIITPNLSLQGILFLLIASFITIVSKYFFKINKKHIFNPAAIAVVITLLLGLGGASWWIGNLVMLPFVSLGGFLIIKKIKRFLMVGSFLLTATVGILIFSLIYEIDFLPTLQNLIIYSPLLFFSTVMLTEPQTSPTIKKWQIVYGAFMGFLYGSIYFTPEQSLLLGNIFAFLVNSKVKQFLTLKQKTKIGPNIYYFLFSSQSKINFKAGQFLEWTLNHKNFDSRGVRRFFSIASSPTEDTIGLGVKFNENGSSFKTKLLELSIGEQIMVSNLGGDFVLPDDKDKRLVFIAGGIGVTPFRSMLKFLMDKGEKRDIIFFYAAKTKEEFVFKDILEKAGKDLKVKIIYETSILDKQRIKKEVNDFKERIFYISGPPSMVDAFKKSLSDIGISPIQIKTDYFPGYN